MGKTVIIFVPLQPGMAPTLSYLCGMATVVYITTCLVVAAVRWFHMCRPYDRHPRYYYPGRPFVTAVYLTSLFLLPYALCPDCEDAWHLAQMFFLPVTLYHFTILLFAYFGNVMQWRKWRLPMVVVGAPVFLSLVAAEVLALVPGNQITILSHVNMLLLGAVVTGVCFFAMWMVARWSRRIDEDNFSNPADFPVVFAHRWIGMVVVNLALCWAGALFDSRALLAVIMLLFSASSVLFIITALHPHRSRPVEDPVAEEASAPEATPAVYNRTLPMGKRQEILDAIRVVVEGQEAFREPHLTLQEVANRSGYNRSYISGLIKAEWGGFFAYVNLLRLSYMDSWLRKHPGGTIQEAVEEAGFSSRQAYYAVKSRLAKKR